MNSVLRISPGWTANTFLDLAINTPLLVVIDNIYLESIALPPCEAHAMAVDSNAILSSSGSAKRFQLIPWGHLQIVERYCRVQNREFLKGPKLQIDRSRRLLPDCQSVSVSLSRKLAIIYILY